MAEDREGNQHSHLELALELRTEVWVATMPALTHRYGKKEKQWVIDHILESMPQLHGIFAFKFTHNAWRFSCQRFLNDKLSMCSNPKRHSPAFCFERLRWSTGRGECNCCKTQYCLNISLLGRIAFGDSPDAQMRHFHLHPYLKEQKMKLQAYFVKIGMKKDIQK